MNRKSRRKFSIRRRPLDGRRRRKRSTRTMLFLWHSNRLVRDRKCLSLHMGTKQGVYSNWSLRLAGGGKAFQPAATSRLKASEYEVDSRTTVDGLPISLMKPGGLKYTWCRFLGLDRNPRFRQPEGGWSVSAEVNCFCPDVKPADGGADPFRADLRSRLHSPAVSVGLSESPGSHITPV